MLTNVKGQINVIFRCDRRNCRATKNIYEDTFFEIARVPALSVLCVLVACILKYQISVISKEIDINRKTTQKLINEFREILTVWLMDNSSKIDGLGDTEIDESAFV